jgi:SAM-dependent methyltransferase
MDIVFAICVMHHIAPPDWADMVREFRRVTKTGGLVVIFEHNPFNPLTRRVVNTCKFDANVVLLKISTAKSIIIKSGLSLVESSYILFFPFRLPVFSRLDYMLRWLPLGAQYFVSGRKL